MNPVYVRALSKIFQSGIDHPNDFARAVDLLGRLLDAGEAVTYVDEIHRYLEKRGASPQMAAEVQKIYEVLDVYKKGEHQYTDDFVQEILKGTP